MGKTVLLTIVFLFGLQNLHAEEEVYGHIGFGITTNKGLKLIIPSSKTFYLNLSYFYAKRRSEFENRSYDYEKIIFGIRRHTNFFKTYKSFIDFDLSATAVGLSNASGTSATYELFWGIEKIFDHKIGIEGKAGIGMKRYSKSSTRLFKFPVTSLSINYYLD